MRRILGVAVGLALAVVLSSAGSALADGVPGYWIVEMLRSSPLTAASGEKLNCTVENAGGAPIAVKAEHFGANGNLIKSQVLNIPAGGFRTSELFVPFGGIEAYCKVSYRVWFPGCGCDAQKWPVRDILKIDVDVRGNLTREDSARRDNAESELVDDGLARDRWLHGMWNECKKMICPPPE